MDGLTFVEHIIGHIAWPSVVIVILLLFRPKLGEIMGRIVEVLLPGGGALRMAPPTQQQDPTMPPPPDRRGLEGTDVLPYYVRGTPDLEPVIQQMEKRIQEDLHTIPNGQRQTVLIRNLVFARLGYWAEGVYSIIFSSQLRLLSRALQAGDAGVSLAEIKEGYEETLRAGKWTEKDYSQLTFVGFLTNNFLIQQDKDGRYRITGLGRAFFQYLISAGRPLAKIP